MHTAAADQALGRNSSEAIRWVDEGRPEGLPFIHTKGKLINWHLSCGNHRLVIASPLLSRTWSTEPHIAPRQFNSFERA